MSKIAPGDMLASKPAQKGVMGSISPQPIMKENDINATKVSSSKSSKAGAAPPLPAMPMDGTWKGHVNGKMMRFRFEQTTNCGLVGQYTYDIFNQDTWIMFAQIYYEDDVLTLIAPHNDGDWFVQGLIACNRVAGPYHPRKGHAGVWEMYK